MIPQVDQRRLHSLRVPFRSEVGQARRFQGLGALIVALHQGQLAQLMLQLRRSPLVPNLRKKAHALVQPDCPLGELALIAGKDAVRHGEAKNSWLTGTAAWNFVAISQYILGVRPEYEGLRVQPCIGKDVPAFTITRKCRGAEYQIRVKNSGGSASKCTYL